MFVIPCKYFDGCWIEDAVRAVKLHHPTARVLVVDSDSQDKTYFDKVKDLGAEVADIANKNYEIGAFWHAVKTYDDDHYVLMQDSIMFNEPIDNIIARTKWLTPFMYFFEPSFGNFNNIETDKWVSRVNEFLGDYLHLPTDRNVNYLGAFGTNFIASRAMVDQMLAKRLDQVFLPTSKSDSWVSERICGIIATQAGVNLLEESFYTDEYHTLKARGYDNATERLQTKYFDKVYCYRQ